MSMHLAQGLPTAFQIDPDEVLFFNGNRVQLLDGKMKWWAVPDISGTNSCWSNRRVMDPSPVLYDHGLPFFVVQAASPNNKRWGWTKYHRNSQHFFTKPFSLEKIFKGAYIYLLPEHTSTA